MATHERFEVVIVGAGPAGIAAACAASSTATVCVVDDNPSPGGQIWRGGKPAEDDTAAASELRRFQGLNIQRMHNTQIVAAPAHDMLLAESAGRTIDIACNKLILATGTRERFLPFPGWTLPNVVGAGGLQALLKSGLPVEGKRIVLAGSGPLLLSVAAYAKQRGAVVPVVAEQAPWHRAAAFGLKLFWLAPDKLRQAVGYRWRLRNALSDRQLADRGTWRH